MNQLDLFQSSQKLPLGEVKKREALKRVASHADIAWKAKAQECILNLARDVERFTTDEVWFALEKSGLKTHERRAIGALMIAAAKDGTLMATNEYLPSDRPECHRRPVRVWESRIY